MAASSSSAATSNYDVFLSHRGPDGTTTFAGYLYLRLKSFGLKVFLGEPELQWENCFAPQIEHAIPSASVHVAIFCVRYAHSEWCLNELVRMLESRAPIIAVVYDVNPTELRRTRGIYGEALDKLARKTTCDPHTGEERLRYDPITIEKWRNALSRCRLELDEFKGDEGRLSEAVARLSEAVAGLVWMLK